MERFNIYQRRDGRYEGRISRGKRSNGTRRFRYFFGAIRDAVRDKMAKARRSEVEISCCKLTVMQLFSEWHRSIQHKVKESTFANYSLKANKHILPSFGRKMVDSIESADVYPFIELKNKRQDFLTDIFRTRLL